MFMSKNTTSRPPHHPGGCHDVGGFFVGVTPSKFWLHAAKKFLTNKERFTIIILASKPPHQQDIVHRTIFS
jgi:hypothetical protein